MHQIAETIIATPAQLPTGLLQSLLDETKPRVMRGLCRDWSLVQAARKSDTDFAQLLAAHDSGSPVSTLRMPPKENGYVSYNADMSYFNYQHFKVTVTEALQKLALYSRQPQGTQVPGVAMQSAMIRDCLPGLLPQLVMPLLPAGVQPRLWFGNRVTTPIHFDGQHNIAVVACGRRRFTLFPPDQIGNLYIGPPDFAPASAAISVARLDQLDDQRFPRLRTALAHAQVAELEPGDALYMPPVWHHHVESLGTLNALVNYWWYPNAGSPAHEPASHALMHSLLAFSTLSRNERDAWRSVFEHYLFSADDPAAHLPEHRRGILGPLDDEKIATLRRLATLHPPRTP